MTDPALLLRHHRAEFYRWDGTCWGTKPDDDLRAELYRFLERAQYWKNEDGMPKLVPWAPTKAKIANVFEALAAICHLPDDTAAPAWIPLSDTVAAPEGLPPPDEILPVANGLLHLPTQTLLKHTPAFFAHHSLPYPYDPNAPQPERWLAFLEQLWDDDTEPKDCLQEIFGYALAGWTRMQRAFLLIGPKRSGRGTIARVLTELLGRHAVVNPTLASITQNFGLQPLIGKPLAIIGDARLSPRTDISAAVERLLSITGEDALTIDRKHRTPWTGTLPTRFLIISNELPRFTDPSGAVASRFIILRFFKSFYGNENTGLTEELLEEAPSVLSWAIAGIDRLREQGRFTQPASSEDLVRHLEDLSSPHGAFVRDCCAIGADYQTTKDGLYVAWRDWCETKGHTHPGTEETFFKDLYAAVPGLRTGRPRVAGDRVYVVQGIRLHRLGDREEV